MAPTYNQIQKQIQQLQRQAESLRNTEVEGVVERIRVAIAHYDLTAEQLGFGTIVKAVRTTQKASKGAAPSAAKFGDGNGNMWSGRGPRPHWLRDALNAGRSIDEFKIDARAQRAPVSAESPAAPPATAPKKAKRSSSKMRYSDDAGNSWGGRGPKPKWLKAALDSGKTLSDFAK